MVHWESKGIHIMSLIDTSKFIEQSRKIYHDSDSNDVSVMLTSILLHLLYTIDLALTRIVMLPCCLRIGINISSCNLFPNPINYFLLWKVYITETSLESESWYIFLLCSINLLVSISDMMCIHPIGKFIYIYM
jgi:hypothetical protein